MHPSLGMTTEERFEMNETCSEGNVQEPKYFLLWIVVWIIALVALLPLLAKA